jgi:hypothetical protein
VDEESVSDDVEREREKKIKFNIRNTDKHTASRLLLYDAIEA